MHDIIDNHHCAVCGGLKNTCRIPEGAFRCKCEAWLGCGCTKENE